MGVGPRKPWLVFLLFTSLLGACAQGSSGRRDAGTPGFDARIRPDSGSPGFDAGGPRDTGPRDAGSPADAGSDAGGGDTGPMCSEEPCKLVAPQCGCPEGEACYLDSDARPTCEEAGRVVTGVRCAGSSACEPGSLCVGSRAQNFCHRMCEVDSDCPEAGSYCALPLGDGMGGTLPRPELCNVACDPIDTLPCPTGTGCRILRDDDPTMRWLTHCTAAGGGDQGDTCSDDRDCMAGFACVGPTGGPTDCRQLCRVAGGTTCPGATTCSSFSEAAIVMGTEYGVCS